MSWLAIFNVLLLPLALLVAAFFIYLIWRNLRRQQAVSGAEQILLSVEVPKLSEKGPVAAEMMFAALHGILNDKAAAGRGGLQDYLSFEIESKLNSIRFYIWVPKHLKEYVEGQVYAQYPTAEIKVVEKDYTILDDEPPHYATTEITLTNKDFFPIKTFEDFEVDPLAGITGVLSNAQANERIWIQILAKPIDDSWHKQGLTYTESVRTGKAFGGLGDLMKKEFSAIPQKVASELLEAISSPGESKGGTGSKKPEKKDKVEVPESQKTALKAIEEKLAKLGFEVKIRAVAFSDTPQIAALKLQGVAGAFKQFNTTMLNGFTPKAVRVDDPQGIKEYASRAFVGKGNILNIAELASLYHLPYESVATPTIVWTSSKKAEPPANLPVEGSVESPSDLSLFGQTNFRAVKTRFGIKRADRFRHTYIIGKSGMGKSELMKLLIISDLLQGKGVAVIDPHGDLAEEVLKYVPENRKDDVVYFNPSDPEYAIGFNPLEAIDPDLKYHVASGFVSIFKKLFGWTWGPRLEHILRYTVLALMDYPNSTMLGVVRMLTDKNFRKRVRKEIKDPAVKNFWQNEFESYSEKFATEAVAPILNKVGQFVATPVIRTIIGQPKSTINLEEIINNGKILIVNLSSGKLGEDNATLLGAMMVTNIQLAAMRRAHQAKEERKEFYLYVDEFQNFATESFAVILSEARKYKLALTVANQYVAQMPEEVMKAVFGNVGTMITFRVGADDAAFLEKEFMPTFEATDLVNLDVQNVYIKMSVDGQTTSPFSATTLIVPQSSHDYAAEIEARSRTQYGRPKVEVEEKISRWQGLLDAEAREEQMKEQQTNEDANRGYRAGGGRDFRRSAPAPSGGANRNRPPERRDNQSSRPPQNNPRPAPMNTPRPATQPTAPAAPKIEATEKIETKELTVRYEPETTPAPTPPPAATNPAPTAPNANNGSLKAGEVVSFKNSREQV